MARTIAFDSREAELKMRALVFLNLFEPSCILAVGLLLEDLSLPALAPTRRIRIIKDPGLHSRFERTHLRLRRIIALDALG